MTTENARLLIQHQDCQLAKCKERSFYAGWKAIVHLEGSSQLLPTVRALLEAFHNADLPPQQQKAITPKFLHKFYQLLVGGPISTQNLGHTHTTNITLGAFFFAMHSCEFTKTSWPGHSKRVRLGCIMFQTQARIVVLAHTNPSLLLLTAFVTIVFEDQKNRKKMDA
jgi:hypothetical protein